MEQKKRIKSEDGEERSRERLGGMQQMKAWESGIGVTVSPSLWLWRLQERRNMVMGVSHPALSRVIGTNGKIESWLNRGRTRWSSCCCRWQKLILWTCQESFTCRQMPLSTTALVLFIEDPRPWKGDAFISCRPEDVKLMEICPSWCHRGRCCLCQNQLCLDSTLLRSPQERRVANLRKAPKTSVLTGP